MYWIVPLFVKIKCLSIINQINIRNISEYRCVVSLDSSKYACLCFFIFISHKVYFCIFCLIFVLVYSVLHTAYDSEKGDCIFEYGIANAEQKKVILEG